MASPDLKRPLSSRPRQRGSHKSSKIKELDRGQIVFVFSVEGIVTLELAFSDTLNAVPRPLYRARYHSLSRLNDTDTYTAVTLRYAAGNIMREELLKLLSLPGGTQGKDTVVPCLMLTPHDIEIA